MAADAYGSVEEWVAREGVLFAIDSSEGIERAVEGMVDGSESVLALGEPLHGSEEMLEIRNRIFRRLVEAKGYTAIAIESSFPRAWVVNEWVAGRLGGTYEEMQERGFSHGFGRAQGNRELVEWMRAYNAEARGGGKLRFYGFDSPTEMTGADSPRQLLRFVLDYLERVGVPGVGERRGRVERLIGEDAGWDNPGASFDPAKSVGGSAEAVALRGEVEELIAELELRRPELGGDEAYWEAVQHARVARQMMGYHAGLARASEDRIARLLGMRDVMIADNVMYAVRRERGGRVFVFGHNSHVQRGKSRWQLGPHALEWWPAGGHLGVMLGEGYRVVGTGVVESEAQGIGAAEGGTVEAHLRARAGEARLVGVPNRDRLPAEVLAGLAKRSASAKNSTYFPLGAYDLRDFSALLVLGSLRR